MSAAPQLQALREAEILAPLDVHFAATLERMAPGQSPAVLIGAAFASRAVSQGNVCADLRRLLGKPLIDPEGQPVDIRLPSIFEWVMQLDQSPLVSRGGDETRPLVFDGEARLYLRRYWSYQQRIAEDLRRRSVTPPPHPVDHDELRRGLDRLFRSNPHQQADPHQILSATVATLRQLAVISGGPGTGKTTTVVRVLALLIEQALAGFRDPPRILLLAPTGKAAARLAESVIAGRDALQTEIDVKEAIPGEASTIHRRLGYRPARPTRFTYGHRNRLPADIVLVDEASMVDIALMAKLLEAVPEHARLILLGDKDQLASVEAGAILGDICNVNGRHAYSSGFARDVESIAGPDVAQSLAVGRATTGIWDCVVELKRSFRFSSSGGIGRLARAINRGQGRDATQALSDPDDPQVILVPLSGESRPGGALLELREVVAARALDETADYFATADPQARLDLLNRFRLLAANRRGPYGTETLNRLIEATLAEAGRINLAGGPWYDGRPIIVLQNDYQLELFNGDVGVLARDSDGQLRAWFPGRDGMRSVLPARLPPHESVYAMTVHKSQGSEFERVGVLLPPAMSPLLTRELLYTAVTRAKRHVTVFGTQAVIHDAVARRIDRASGLSETLWR